MMWLMGRLWGCFRQPRIHLMINIGYGKTCHSRYARSAVVFSFL
ncbi:hypothetical protein [Moraxella lacunata]